MQERGSRQLGFPHSRSSELKILKSNAHVRGLALLVILTLRMFSLLDPSCSGSGIVNRLDYLLESGSFRELFPYWALICQRERRDRGGGEPS